MSETEKSVRVGAYRAYSDGEYLGRFFTRDRAMSAIRRTAEFFGSEVWDDSGPRPRRVYRNTNP